MRLREAGGLFASACDDGDDEAVTLQIEIVHSDSGRGVVVADVMVQGEVDMATSNQLTEAVEQAVAAGPTLVRLDFTGTSFLDSSGLRAIVTAEQHAAQAGTRLTIAGMSAAVQQVLEITGLLEQYRDGDTATSA